MERPGFGWQQLAEDRLVQLPDGHRGEGGQGGVEVVVEEGKEEVVKMNKKRSVWPWLWLCVVVAVVFARSLSSIIRAGA